MKIFILALSWCFTTTLAFGQSKGAKEQYEAGYRLIDERSYSAAVASFLLAIQADPTGECGTGMPGKAHGELGTAYTYLDDSVNARIYFNKSIALGPANCLTRQNKAALLTRQGRYAEARQVLAELLRIKSDWTGAYVQRGFINRTEGKSEAAIADFNQALLLNKKENSLPKELVTQLKQYIKEVSH